MKDLHRKLMNESNWYNAWHSHKGHGLAHWFLFLFFVVLLSSVLMESINKNYLSDNLNVAASVIAIKPTFPNKTSVLIPGQYIIVFKDDVRDVKGLRDQLLKDSGGQLLFAYSKAIKGFSAKIPEVAINGLRKNPNVKYVEQDRIGYISTTAQSNATYGLDRIDQPTQPIDLIYKYNYTGLGVNAYVLDTGIRSTHSEFWKTNTTISRVGNGFTSISDGYGTDDCDGHGTYVAGIIGGTTYGVAKGVTLHPVRVMDCTGAGTVSGIINGIDWIINNKISPSVANMSLNFSIYIQTINDAVRNLVNSGVTVSIAAGNGANDSCTFSPASEPSAITVAAVNSGNTSAADTPASFSSFGTCVDIYAPGVSIKSAWNTSDFATMGASGTSASSPLVAGVAALYLEKNPTATPEEVTQAILVGATAGVLTYLPAGSPDFLLNSLFSGVFVPPHDSQAPTAPSGLVATSPDFNHINLTWASSTDNVGVIGYQVFRTWENQGAWNFSTTSVPSYNDNYWLLGGHTYSYIIKAFDAAGNYSGGSNKVTIVTPAAPTAVTINSSSATNISSTTVTINWQTNTPTIGTLSLTNPKQALRTFYITDYKLNESIKVTGLTPKTSYSYFIDASNGTSHKDAVGTFKTLGK